MSKLKKIILVSEYFNPPFDEGIKKTVYNLYSHLKDNYAVKVITRSGSESKNIFKVKSNKLFLSFEIKKIIKDFNPDILIYLPFSSSTIYSYIRNTFLSLYLKKNAKSIFIALQPKMLGIFHRILFSLFKPQIALTPSPDLKKYWDKKAIKNSLIPICTDEKIFKPISNDKKNILREKYNIPINSFIISHVGHLSIERNLDSLILLQNNNNQIVIVLSSSTPKDAIGPQSLRNILMENGIIIIDNYIKNIQEIYQLSDIYIFPVTSKRGCIGFPLSVLEAYSCGIPVISTDFGSLKYYLGNAENIIFSEPNNFLKDINLIKNNKMKNDPKKNIKNINSIFYNTLSDIIG